MSPVSATYIIYAAHILKQIDRERERERERLIYPRITKLSPVSGLMPAAPDAKFKPLSTSSSRANAYGGMKLRKPSNCADMIQNK